jgi:hypothetical protein
LLREIPTFSNTLAARAAPQDILLELVYDEFALILAARRRQAEHDAELARFLATVDTWAHGRIEALRTQHADRLTVAALLLEENQIWWERQQRLVVLHGFFDDSLISAFAWNETAQQFTGADGVTHGCASIDGLLPDVIRAILEVADDIGLETAAHKIEVGTDDGRTGTILIEAWRQDCAAGLPATSRRILWNLRPGCMVALGKELDMQRQRVSDTEERVAGLSADVRAMVDAANAALHNGRPTTPIAPLRSIIGRAFFTVGTEPWLRSALNVPLRSLRVLEALYPSLERAYRNSKRRGGHVPWFSWTYFDLKAQDAMLDFIQGARSRRGLPFNPSDPTPGSGGRPAVWVVEDASGSDGGGGGAIYVPAPSDEGCLMPGPMPFTRATPVWWSYDAFSAQLTAASSTEQEAANANTNLRRALALGYTDVVEVLDNAAWVFVARSGACRSAALAHQATERAAILAQHQNARIYSVWQPRERGTIPDGISKLDLPYQAPSTSQAGLPPPGGWTGRSWVNAELQARGHATGLADAHRLQ